MKPVVLEDRTERYSIGGPWRFRIIATEYPDVYIHAALPPGKSWQFMTHKLISDKHGNGSLDFMVYEEFMGCPMWKQARRTTLSAAMKDAAKLSTRSGRDPRRIRKHGREYVVRNPWGNIEYFNEVKNLISSAPAAC